MSHQLKLDRASHHLACLDAKVREWTEGKPHRYVTKIDRKSHKKFVNIRLLKPPPDEFRLIIGDCLHNLRSALDSLVYELASPTTTFIPCLRTELKFWSSPSLATG